ncbi:MAG: sulfite exporter TauE/SafE family protein [Bacteroidetes bacterium]|nr:sulfite exporter TauE/SafE family protein [Bacteroidota bacterium]
MHDLNNLLFSLFIYIGSFFAGLLGSLTGLGGGIIIVPMLTVLFGVDIHFAAGASLISVISTSSGAASAYVKEGYSNIRIGMFLEMATTIGAVIGAYLAGVFSVKAISIIFATILVYSAISSLFFRKELGDFSKENKYARIFKLNGKYPTPKGEQSYSVQNVPLGFALSSFAGIMSGLLGIGGGAIKVIAMDRIMKIPFKVSTTTSNFMIGVTAAASAGIYLKNGYIHASLVMPVMLGVLTGAFLGTKILAVASSRSLKIVFSIIIIIMAYEMLKNGLK